MKKGKKVSIISIGVVLAILIMLMTGCGSQQATNPEDSQSSVNNAQTNENPSNASESEPYNIVWYAVGGPQDDMASVLNEVNKIITPKINATLDLRYIDWGSYNDKMKMMMAAGEEFDLCFTANWMNDFYKGVANGAFIPLDDLLNKYGQNIISALPEKYWSNAKVDGKTYAVLNQQTFTSVKGLTVNADLMDKYGFDPKSIKTRKDMEPFFDKILENEKTLTPYLPEVNGIGSPFDSNTGIAYHGFNNVEIAVTRTDDPTNKVVSKLDQPEFMSMLNLMREWQKKGYIRKDAASVKDWVSEKNSGKYVCVEAGNVLPGSEATDSIAMGFRVYNIAISPPFQGPVEASGSMVAISRTSKNPDVCMQFYDMNYSDKQLYNLLCYGIEGKHYTVIDKDTQTIEPIDNSGYWPNINWEIGNQFNSYFVKGQEPTVWEEMADLNANATTTSLFGFYFDSDPVKSQIVQLDAIWQEYWRQLGTGSVDPAATVETMKDRFEKAGQAEVFAELQQQIEKWKEVNGK